MKTFLFAWNPKKWDWVNLAQSIEDINNVGFTTQKWSVVSHRKINPGDRAFLIRLGKEPKGIMASGFVTSAPFLSPHWSGDDKLVPRVLIKFEVILDPESDSLLSLEKLRSGNLAAVNWTPQSSGIEIHTEFVDHLEQTWFDFIGSQKELNKSDVSLKENDIAVFAEGGPNQIMVTKYERNPYARKACIEHYGPSCFVCGFNFYDHYGKIGEDFIHVHHLFQLSKVGEDSLIDPIKDLRPVCPNCHAMIHKRKEAYSIDEIKALIKDKSI